jgi:lipoprotein-anchoring transpeptidase ErfK/SrfK
LRIDAVASPPIYLRHEVSYGGPEAPGTIIVDPGAHFLYHIEDGGRATRYGVGVGREGFGWNGTAVVKNKQEWPKWFPPSDMQLRDPRAAAFKNGMPGGPSNPLGARAMYLWQGNHDTLYRIHGTNEPESIGKSMSSGCIRMLNQDVIDLYNRVQPGAKVVVLPSDGATSYAAGEPVEGGPVPYDGSVL